MKVSLSVFTLGLMPVALGAAFDSSTCVDKAGFEKCYASADSALTSCVSNNCGGSVCVKSCNGDPTCVLQDCPSLGLDCLNACECIRNTKRVTCAAESCWNQAYSCEYQDAVADMVDLCQDTDRNAIPYFPAPDSAPGSCSCNKGKLSLTIEKIGTQLTACGNNQTNLNPLGSASDISTYGQACLCCTIAYMQSAIWDICPTTQPALLAADNITAIYGRHFAECSQLLPSIDCQNDLGYGAAVGDAMSSYHALDDLPKNGTETLYNKEGALASPTQATITWTPESGFSPETIVAAQATKEVSSTKTGGAMTASKTGSAAASGSQSAASASASTTPNAASKEQGFWMLMTVCVVLAVAFF